MWEEIAVQIACRVGTGRSTVPTYLHSTYTHLASTHYENSTRLHNNPSLHSLPV